MDIVFSMQAEELVALLQTDQKEYKEYSRKYYWGDDQQDAVASAKKVFRLHVAARAKRMLEILEEVKEPSLSNIGKDAAQAMSILATHSSLTNTNKILAAFEACYERSRDDTYYQAIPSMTDWALLLSRKPQRFGTIWLFDENKQPYLPTVEDFKTIDQRRAEYDIEPLRWPKSLAIPEGEQPWLRQPLSELVMRDLSDSEYKELSQDYL